MIAEMIISGSTVVAVAVTGLTAVMARPACKAVIAATSPVITRGMAALGSMATVMAGQTGKVVGAVPGSIFK